VDRGRPSSRLTAGRGRRLRLRAEVLQHRQRLRGRGDYCHRRILCLRTQTRC